MNNNRFQNDEIFAKFINYMQKALLHKRLNYIRDNKRIIETECSINDFENSLQTEEKVDLHIFESLNIKEQKVLKLHIVDKLTYKEISKILNLQPESVRKIKYRALKKLERE